MGTRHLTAVMYHGEYLVAQYGQWDGYPSGQGLTVLGFLRDRMTEKFLENLLKCTYPTEEETKALWVACGADPNSPFVGMDVSDAFKKNSASLARDTGAKVLDLIEEAPQKLVRDLEFVGDSLFCEWAYVVDLDQNLFEIYKGFNTKPLAPGERFSHLSPRPADASIKSPTYYPVRHAISFTMENLPSNSDFLELIAPIESDESDSNEAGA